MVHRAVYAQCFRESGSGRDILHPLIDAILTVMIIFMITAPIVARNVDFALVGGKDDQARSEPRLLILSIHDSCVIRLNGESIDRLDLARSLNAGVVAGIPLPGISRTEARGPACNNPAQGLLIAQDNEVASFSGIASAG